MGDKKTSEAQRRAVAKYDAEHTVVYRMKLNKKTDSDIIGRLEDERTKNPTTGIQGYLKKLVRDDIKARD